jgi:hypothetical protein
MFRHRESKVKTKQKQVLERLNVRAFFGRSRIKTKQKQQEFELGHY